MAGITVSIGKKFLDQLDLYRSSSRITWKEFQNDTGIGQSTFHRWKNLLTDPESTTEVSLETLVGVCKGMSTPPEALWLPVQTQHAVRSRLNWIKQGGDWVPDAPSKLPPELSGQQPQPPLEPSAPPEFQSGPIQVLSSTFPSLPQPFEGRETEVGLIRDHLRISPLQPRKFHRQVGIYGPPGMGKTSLGLRIAHDEGIARMYRAILWCHLGSECHSQRVQNVLMEWARCLGFEPFGELQQATTREETCELANERIHQRLVAYVASLGVPILLIIDDVWNSSLLDPLLISPNVVITTRQRNLAGEEGRIPVNLEGLDEVAAVRLFQRQASLSYQAEPELCRRLLHELDYSPLGIHVASRYLHRTWERHQGLSLQEIVAELLERGVILREQVPANLVRFLDESVNLTVAGLIDRSVELLDEVEQECFASLGELAVRPATFGWDLMQQLFEPIIVSCSRSVSDIANTLIDLGLIELRGRTDLGQGSVYQIHALIALYANALIDEDEDSPEE